MIKKVQRFLSVLLALVLAVSLAMPALAATPVNGVTLDQTEAILAPGETLTLTAGVTPADATNQKVTWKSNKTAVAVVKDGVVTAKGLGTADITVTTADGGYTAVCKVTVENNYVADLVITPAGPETLPVGTDRQLNAQVLYAHAPAGSQSVTWSSDAPAVATVTPEGVVTAVAEGQASIMAMTSEKGKDGTPIFKTYSLTVSDSRPGDSSADRLFLAQTRQELPGGLYQTITLTAPGASVVRDETDVTEDYELSYVWTNSDGAVISREQTAALSLMAQEQVEVTCTVTAANRTDSTREPLTAACVCAVTVLPGTVVSATLDVNAGATPLSKLGDKSSGLSVLDQLTKGGATQLTPAIPGLQEVRFYPDEATGEAGALNVAADQTYGLGEDAGQKLADVVFTPVIAGTYIIPFLAVAEQTYYGQLELVVTGEADPTLTADADMTCDSSGLTFAGSDFYKASESDPVAACTFGKPSAGQLLRDMKFGSGAPDAGSWYYTDSAKDGDYHVSTLSYLPPAGFSGKVSIPLGVLSKSGLRGDGFLVIEVKHKTASDTFADVSEASYGSWAADAVDFAYDSGLVNGTGDSAFSPGATMTRAMLVTVLYRAAGSPVMTVTTNFEDLNANSYYYNAVVWANAMGVVTGTSDKTFDPDAAVTRQQIAVILYRYAAMSGHADTSAGASLDAYTDKGQVGSYALKGMGWAVSKGIITGTSTTTLSPDDPATRAQVVVMLHRYLAV